MGRNNLVYTTSSQPFPNLSYVFACDVAWPSVHVHRLIKCFNHPQMDACVRLRNELWDDRCFGRDVEAKL